MTAILLCLEGQRLQVAYLDEHDPAQRTAAQLRFQDHACVCPICSAYLSLLASMDYWRLVDLDPKESEAKDD